MKKQIIAIITTISVIIGALIITPVVNSTEQQDHCHIEDDYIYHFYLITLIDDHYYHGDSLTDNNHLLFTDENILSKQQLKVGDTVVAVYEKDELITIEIVE